MFDDAPIVLRKGCLAHTYLLSINDVGAKQRSTTLLAVDAVAKLTFDGQAAD